MQYGRYRIIKELGKGSMGVVYQAHDPQIDRAVALKVLRPDRVDSEAFVHRFIKEAKAVGRLSHPNIVVVYDIGEDHGTVYISMEYLEGKPLSEVLKERSLSLSQALRIGIQVSDALDYAHRKGIVHRDIKPSNIIVQSDDSVKITDFGIARIEDPLATQQTQAGEILGTPAYMAPEQVLGQPVDGRSDLFSLGVILYELTAGQRPFSGESLITMFRSITEDTPREPLELNPSLPRDFSRVVLKSLAKEPRNRFSSGRDLSEALRHSLKLVEPAPAVFPTSTIEGRRRPIPLPMILVALAVVAGLVAGSVFLMRTGFKDSAAPPGPQGQQPASGREDRTEGHPPLPSAEPLQAQPPAQPWQPPAQGAGQPRTDESSTHASPPPPEPAAELSSMGSLKIESRPVGAEVSIGGESRGATPLEIALPPGAHEVRITLAGHGDWEAQVKVAQNRVTHLPVELMPMP
ncbi:MAG: protein kinase [Syntrophobacteraceae bacterium]|jgi:serine/threonine-protein kinase|nr:protein kinase [Syntrophobacteraceae bacterium]